MSEETKQELEIVLELLRKTCIRNGVSVGFDKKDEELIFFDTRTYLEYGRFSGIKTTLDNLVR